MNIFSEKLKTFEAVQRFVNIVKTECFTNVIGYFHSKKKPFCGTVKKYIFFLLNRKMIVFESNLTTIHFELLRLEKRSRRDVSLNVSVIANLMRNKKDDFALEV